MGKNHPKTKLAKFGRIAATFGVAGSTLFVAPEMNADVVSLTYNGAESAFNPFVAATDLPPYILAVDQVSNSAWPQWNDSYEGTGRTQPFFLLSNPVGPMSATVVEFGQVIDPATFVGISPCKAFGCDTSVGVGNGTEFDGTGSAFVAWRPRSNPGNLCWFKIDFAAAAEIRYSCGQYGDAGETLVVGVGDGDCACLGSQVGDLDGNGLVDLLDIEPFVESLNGKFQCEADVNQDGSVDLLDIDPFVKLLLN